MPAGCGFIKRHETRGLLRLDVELERPSQNSFSAMLALPPAGIVKDLLAYQDNGSILERYSLWVLRINR